MKKLMREPLVHFLLLGAAIFVAYSLVSKRTSGEPGQIVVTQGQLASMKVGFTRIWQRPPTSKELEGLIRDRVREEVYYREALALGLDKDDLIIRRRLAQKVEFLVQDTLRLTAPTDADLRRCYEANLESFQTRARVSFTQVFFNPETRRNAAADAKAALAALSRGAAATSHTGDPFPLDAEVRDYDMQTVAGQFGDSFANAVFALKPGAWHGPITSSFGLHLVRVTEAKPVRQLEFSEVEAKVRERWRDEHERAANERYFATLLKKYGVAVDESLKPLIGPLNGFAVRANATVAQGPK